MIHGLLHTLRFKVPQSCQAVRIHQQELVLAQVQPFKRRAGSWKKRPATARHTSAEYGMLGCGQFTPYLSSSASIATEPSAASARTPAPQCSKTMTGLENRLCICWFSHPSGLPFQRQRMFVDLDLVSRRLSPQPCLHDLPGGGACVQYTASILSSVLEDACDCAAGSGLWLSRHCRVCAEVDKCDLAEGWSANVTYCSRTACH